MRPMIKPDGFNCWEYVLMYVDDILVISHEPEKLMESLSALYRLKEDPLAKKEYPRNISERILGSSTFHRVETPLGSCRLTPMSRRL